MESSPFCLLLLLSCIFLSIDSDSTVDAKSISSKKSSDIVCILQYLVHNNIIQESDLKGKYKNLPAPSEICNERMKKSNAEFYRQMDRKTTGDRDIDKCIRSTLRQHNVTNIVLKEISMFHINGQRDTSVMRDLKTIKERIFKTSELICQRQGEFQAFEFLKKSLLIKQISRYFRSQYQ